MRQVLIREGPDLLHKLLEIVGVSPAEADDITDNIQKVADKLAPIGNIPSPAIDHPTTQSADSSERYV